MDKDTIKAIEIIVATISMAILIGFNLYIGIFLLIGSLIASIVMRIAN